MTKEEILDMEAGRQLDGLVAQEIMDIKVEYPYSKGFPYYLFEDSTGRKVWNAVALYSTDISAAWPIAVKMGLAVIPLNNGDWACCKASYIYHLAITQYHYADPNVVICKAAPEAICKAALLTRLDEVRRLEVKA